MPTEKHIGVTVSSEDGSSATKVKGQPNRRRTKISDKKIADDEFMAASIGDVEWLKQSIKDKSCLSYDKNGLAPIHLAAIHGRLDCLKYLIEKQKVDVNLPSTTGWRPLHLAISNQTGNRAIQCILYLLEKGADPSLVNEDEITPCHQAASEGHVQCLKLLIELGSKVDGKDCRGHTPLDLAKLWGHRKCARILSAEVWHQEKDHVAKEMNQLKRLKMQQVLNEIENEEQEKAAQEFYGDIAFKDWLNKRNLDHKPTGPMEDGKRTPETKGKPQNSFAKESLYKANSVTIKPSASTEKKAVKKVEADKNYNSYSKESSGISELQEPDSGLERTDTVQVPKECSPVPVYTNLMDWVKSTKVPPSDYTVNLSDDYPRDAYTMMPIKEDAPKFYDGSFWRKAETPENEVEKLKKKKLRNPDLPKETVQRVMSRDHTRLQRPFIFRPIHIHDVNMKRKCSEEKQRLSETSLHMCNDVSSYMFQKSLQKSNLGSRAQSSSSTKSSGSTKTVDSDRTRQKMLSTFKSLSEPSTFPPIRGEEYGLHLVK